MTSRRVQIELAAKSFERLQRLKSLTETSSHAEVLRNALRLYEYAIDKSSQGAMFLVQKDDKAPEVVKLFADEAS